MGSMKDDTVEMHEAFTMKHHSDLMGGEVIRNRTKYRDWLIVMC